jgi:hypothetical protein
MPADVRVVRERELATCEHDLEEKTRAAKEAKYRQKMIGRYHQVRFFGEYSIMLEDGRRACFNALQNVKRLPES